MPEWGSVAQWFAAFATLFAVYVALQQNKTKVKILFRECASLYPDLENFRLKITIVNIKAIPITIKEGSFMTWRDKRGRTYNYIGMRLPKILNTSESIEFEISDGELINEFKSLYPSGKILLKFYVLDSTHRFHCKYFVLDMDKKKIYYKWWDFISFKWFQ